MMDAKEQELIEMLDPFVGLPPVLDACCGARQMWFDKQDERALYADIRVEDHTYLNGQRKEYAIHVAPDRVADFTNLPFPSDTFALVVFDPPHLMDKSRGGHMAKKYGTLPHDWADMLRLGFSECFRVLRPEGVLVFKWSSHHIPLADVLALTPERPLFGNRKPHMTKTHWVLYMKPNAAGQGRRKPYPEPACSALDSEEHEGREERCDACGEISHCLIRGLCPPCYELNGGTHE